MQAHSMPYPRDYKEWLAKLVSFDTVSRNSNLPLVYYVRAYLESAGVESTLIYSPEKTHANLWATLPGEGGVTQGGIVLSGHTDVVPVDGQAWDTDPFTMVEKDGKLHGRGTTDMKGFLAVALSLTPTFLQMKRAKPIHYAFSYDEEVGCTGVPHLIDYLKNKGFTADGCVVGESTHMTVYTANKGFASWKVEVQGKAIHSSMALMGTSCNAIEYAAAIIAKIREVALSLRKNAGVDYSSKGSAADIRDTSPFDYPPFSPMTTGMIEGGNAVNTVPADCRFIFSVRITDSAVATEVEDTVNSFIQNTVLPAMREEYPEAVVELVNTVRMPAFNASVNSPFTADVRSICKDVEERKKGGGTEAGFFQEHLGIPTVIVGPGTVKVAHMANEYVLVSMMERCREFMVDLATLYTSSAAAKAAAL